MRYLDRGFRPLAGMNCFLAKGAKAYVCNGFRPLAGMNCFLDRPRFADGRRCVSVPLRG